ncbi:hypothetical protein CORC01_03484 [Colletotrichum orchidophilum]|uniref:Secreted protein n=1 Tax=Colletotrichum orchidophilum TaxID=1209926 RepID=A0A1G4BI33_9PEZI|nr:uncharacterized protein CORC01_03484 [Colletotrichum orchidophilum]OHF01170.1 hypothetical protein CORC01_03484 [Colletotrichum orchidophilum]
MFFWLREVDLWVMLVVVRGEKRWSDFLDATRLRPWPQPTCSQRHLTPHVGTGCDPVRVILLDCLVSPFSGDGEGYFGIF